MRQRREIRLKVSLRRVAWMSSTLIVVLAIGFTLFFNFSSKDEAYAAVSGEYRSKTSGNWNATSSWQRYNGSSWVNATATPTSSDNIITIQSGHTISIAANVTADQIVINSGGTLTLTSGRTLTVANGSGTDLSVSGTITNSGTISSSGATINFQNGGKYNHVFTTSPGTIPTATWSSGSVCEIAAYVSNTSAPSGLSQSFAGFIWNCPLQLGEINLIGALKTITENFTVTSTGLGKLVMSEDQNPTINIGGDFTLTAGTFVLANKSNATPTMNIAGNYSQVLGSFTVVDGNSAVGNVNVSGNWTHTAGTITVSGNSSTSAAISFSKSGSQTFTTTAPIVLGNVDFNVNSGSTLVMGSSIMLGRNFTLSAGGGLSLGSDQGITATGLLGNIQVTGVRSYSTGADYIYEGGTSQSTGGGIPSTVRNLTVNNGGVLTLTSDFTVTGVLNLANGKISTDRYTLYVTHTSTNSIVGYSSNNFVIGNLSRGVSGTGTYDFPLGIGIKYELMTVRLSATAGFNRLLASFTNTNPNTDTTGIQNIDIGGVEMYELLDFGYWTLTPNSSLTSGKYTLTVNEQGYTNDLTETSVLSLINRKEISSPWQSIGNHNDNTQKVAPPTATAERSSLNTFGIFAIAKGDYAMFANPTLRAGTAGATGAIYVFPNVIPKVDAWVEITNISGGASLSSIDDQSTGYDASFQPFIYYPPGVDSYIEWRFRFKKNGTSTDTTLRKIVATGVDVDGSSSGGRNIREYIEATMPTSYNLDNSSTITVTNISGRYRALGSSATVSSIDTSARQAMYELNYFNVNEILYRTGSVSTMSSGQVRQTSLFFRAFYLGVRNIALPIKLISFNAKIKNNNVNINWATAAEVNNDYFTIERSSDGETFEPLFTKRGAGNSTVTLEYEANDPNPLEGYSYYRLKQTDFDGHFSYSEVETVKNKGGNDIDETKIDITSISPNPFTDEFKVDFILKQKTPVEINMISTKGEVIFSESIMAEDGYNSYSYTDSKGLSPGYYFVTISYKDQKVTKKILKN
ncbi:MAG: T9SS type A sorting domain-containing protein [Bacteroidota bacterium]